MDILKYVKFSLFLHEQEENVSIPWPLEISGPVTAKGQLISKCPFGVFHFLRKTNKNKSTCGSILVKLSSFVCLFEEMSAWKNYFDFVWPLGSSSWIAWFENMKKYRFRAGKQFFDIPCPKSALVKLLQ